MTGARSGPTAAQPLAGTALTSVSVVRQLLADHGLRPARDFGQNFLVDAAALRAIVAAADLSAADTVLEVGPGLGVLTRELAAVSGQVVSVELDRRLAPVLEQTLAGLDNVTVTFADALAFDFGSLPGGAVMVANLPYNIATPLVARALESGRFARMVFLVQREVAERMVATPATPAFGALSLLVRHFGSAKVVRHVSAAAFYPPPEVTSSVVRIDVATGRARDDELFALIRRAFAHRRKTLRKNLVLAGYDDGVVRRALTELNLGERVRAEALGLDDFTRLRERLHIAPLSRS